MGECPVCGESTSKASTRLIKDSCGHIKCRLCLLNEENGCIICNRETIGDTGQKIDCIGNFDFPLPLAKPSDYENTNFISQSITVDKSYDYHIGPSVDSVVNDEHSKDDSAFGGRENRIEGKEIVINETHDIDDEAFEIGLSESNANDIIGKIGDNVLEFIEKEAFDTETKDTNLNQENEGITDNAVQSNMAQKCVSPNQSTGRSNLNDQSEDASNKTLNLSPNSDCRLPKKRFVAEQTQNLVQRLDESHNEDYDQLITPAVIVNRSPSKSPSNSLSVEGSSRIYTSELTTGNGTPNLDQFNKTPNYYDNYKSPDFRLQDYIVFKKPGDVMNSQVFASPVYSEDFTSSGVETRGLDHSSNNDKTFNENENEKDLLFELVVNRNLEKSAHFVSSVVNNVNFSDQSVSEDTSKVHQEDNIPFECLKNDCNSLGDLILRLEEKLGSNESIVNDVHNSHNRETECDNPSTNSDSFVDREKQNFVEEENEDEDKENKECTKLENHIENQIEAKVITSSGNMNSCKFEKNQKDEKTICKSQIENGREKGKDTKIEKKRKVQFVDQKDEQAKKKKRVAYQARREPNRDWRHIITLPTCPATYKCSICKKVFKSLKGRGYHVSCLRGDVPFQCKICNRVFTKRSHFEYHERVHQDYKPFGCPICKKKFVQKNKLNRHMQIHKKSCEYECADCGNKYMTKEYLKNHIMVHTNISFKCTICSKSFSHDTNRKRHERTHTTERKYECEICHKLFKTKFLKTRHKRTHDTASRTLQCDHCKRLFMYKFELQRHMHVHSPKTPFKCNLCKLRFRRRDNLLRHVRNHHPGEQEIAFRDETKEFEGTESIENGNKEEDVLETKKDKIVLESRKVKVKKVEKKENTKKVAKKEKKVRPKKLEKKEGKSRAKRISRTNSTSSAKSSKSPRRLMPNSPNPTAALPDPDVPLSSPINIQRLDEIEEVNRSLIDPIPLEKVLDLNKQIEEKMYKQSSFFCDFPGLSRKIKSSAGRRDSSGSNSNSNDGMSFNQERSKTGQSSKDKNAEDADGSEIVRKDLHVHWRRRTAESLRSKMNKNKQA